MTESKEPARSEDTRVGQPFNLFRHLTGIIIPEAPVPSDLVSAGARLA
jgi:hypothetical protein